MKDQKQQLRKEHAELRRFIPDKSKLKKSKIICDLLLNNKHVIGAKNILLYYPTLDEVDIKPVINYCWEKGKNVYFPFIKEVKIGKADGIDDLRDFNSRFKEPSVQAEELPLLKLDLVILPGVGFDNNRNRLGRGKGWYDKYIGTLKHKPILIGVCFKEQLLEEIPYEKHDIRTDEVLTA